MLQVNALTPTLGSSPTNSPRNNEPAVPTSASLPHNIGCKKVTCHFKGCEKKVPLAFQDTACKCKGIYCDQHRFFAYHNCPFDYKADWQERTRKLQTNDSKRMIERENHYTGGDAAF